MTGGPDVEEQLLELARAILENLGFESDQINKIQILQGDTLYLKIFEEMFEDVDFTQLEPAYSKEEQGDNLDTLIELLGSQAIEEDLSYIKGSEIVMGNH